MKIKNKYIKLLVLASLFFVSFNLNNIDAATSFSISSNKSTVHPGDTFTITVSSNGEGRFDASVSNGTITSNNNFWYPEGKSFTVKAGNIGTTTVKVIAVDVSDGNDVLIDESKSVNVNVVEKPAATPSPTPTPTPTPKPSEPSTPTPKPSEPSTPTETEEEKAEREKREKEAALAEKRRNPLIKEFKINSKSERLQDENIASMLSLYDIFNYEYELPRNINKFEIELETYTEDTNLTYDKVYELEDDQDELEIKIFAKDDEIEQDFIFVVKRHKESELVISHGEGKHTLLVDSLIDTKLKEYGVERNLFNEEQDDFYYYEYKGMKFVLVYDESGVSHWFMVSDSGEIGREVILFIDNEANIRFLVDEKLNDEKRTINGNSYKTIDLNLPYSVRELDPLNNYNNKISAWPYGEEGFVTHELLKYHSNESANTEEQGILEDEVRLVYIGENAEVIPAFIAFDDGPNLMGLVYVLGGLLALVLLVFIIYWRSTSRKIKRLMQRQLT